MQRAHRVDHREQHQRDRDHLDQVDVDIAQRREPRFRERTHQPAGERAQGETAEHALPEGNP